MRTVQRLDGGGDVARLGQRYPEQVMRRRVRALVLQDLPQAPDGFVRTAGIQCLPSLL
jgi:hypothetical protein